MSGGWCVVQTNCQHAVYYPLYRASTPGLWVGYAQPNNLEAR